MHNVVVALGLAATGCVSEPVLSETESASTVGDYASSGCSTAVVIGLSKQVAEQANCEHPGDFVSFEATNGITFTSSAVLPFLDKSARDDLQAVGASSSLQVNSGLRTLAQQYLLYRWYQQGLCGISAAATVGNSNHEGGRAVDLANYAVRVSAMAARGWAYDVPGDVVHFDHTSSPDHRGEDIHAFQVLWNLNHPNDTITADGSYGPQTEARLTQAPATGFAMGATCGTQQTFAADIVSIVGPDTAPPQTQVHYSIVLKNTGTIDWPGTTTLELASGASSPLHDASWTSNTIVMTLDSPVAAGHQGTIDFDITTPAETVATPVAEMFALDDAGTKFGMINLALTVVPGMAQPTSGDGGDGHDPGASNGGCNAGGGGSRWLALVLPLIVLRRRRR